MRFITFSDIHYKTEYKTDDHITAYLKSFKDTIIGLNDNQPIDAVFISGDIAFSGEGDQYQELKVALRQNLPDSIPIFSVLGNHDVNWAYLKDAIGRKKSLENLFSFTEEDIINELEKTNSKFKKVFKEFRENFDSKINEEIEPKYLINYCPKSYAGYIWFSEFKMLFVLLNSAWYSFGPGVIKDYYDEMVEPLGPDEIKRKFFDFLGEAYSQEGKQSYFFSSFPFSNEISKILKSNNDARVITLAHHPPSWLKWEEQFTTDPDKRNLSELLSVTDLLITGHLHSPVLPPSLLQNTCFHLSNGPFLDYHYIESNVIKTNPIGKFPNNWFNLIEIDSDSFTCNCFNLKIVPIGKGHLNYKFEWSPIIMDTYDFKKDNYSEETIVNKKKGKLVKIKLFKPKNLDSLIKSLGSKRKNIFYLPDPSNNKIEIDAVNVLKSSHEEYLIILNNLDRMYKIIDQSKKFENLAEDSLFENLINALDTYKLKDLPMPVIAFYDFIEAIDDKDVYAEYQNRKFILFQSFKHKFFSKFEELFKFTELSIIYDVISV